MNTTNEQILTTKLVKKKVYVKPEIIYELLLETRAGSELPPLYSPPWTSGDSIP